MKNPDWGTKRICQGCASKYYDLNRVPVLCPKCRAEFDPTSGLRLRSDVSYKATGGRAKSVFGTSSSPLRLIEPAPDAVGEAEAQEQDADEVEDAERDGDSVEDVSELGDDSADLAEIVETDADRDS